MRMGILIEMALLAVLAGSAIDSVADDRLAVRALVNGKPARLALDTGAERSILFRSAATRLGLNTASEGRKDLTLNGAVRADWSPTCQLEWGSVRKVIRFGIVDVPAYQSWDMDGCIGWSDVRDLGNSTGRRKRQLDGAWRNARPPRRMDEVETERPVRGS